MLLFGTMSLESWTEASVIIGAVATLVSLVAVPALRAYTAAVRAERWIAATDSRLAEGDDWMKKTDDWRKDTTVVLASLQQRVDTGFGHAIAAQGRVEDRLKDLANRERESQERVESKLDKITDRVSSIDSRLSRLEGSQ